ncbi:MAG: glycosyltransferase family 4 protein [Anaerolineae bacterium]|nr:glycosyltransferase family 4 protein [Anaerolineae bacterium]
MHVAINGWFWDRPDTGSGQYLRRTIDAFAHRYPSLQITIITPGGGEIALPPASITVHQTGQSRRDNLAKLRFEQQIFPAAAARIGADLIHIPYWGSPFRSPIPIVVTIHDLIPLIYPAYRGKLTARLYTSLVAASARGAQAVITDSEASRRDILDHLKLPDERVSAILLAAGDRYQPEPDTQRDQEVRARFDLPGDYVLYLGGYDVRKNISTLLKAYTYLQESTGSDLPLVLAGRLPEKRNPRFTDVAGLIESMKLQDTVRPIGWIDEEDAPSLYRMARCFVYPSCYEGFGLPPLEAMACGTPVVAANTSSLPEVVGEAGFLVAPDDARGMAGAILSIYNQPDLAESLREKTLQRAALFTWEKTARETIEVYETALSER